MAVSISPASAAEDGKVFISTDAGDFNLDPLLHEARIANEDEVKIVKLSDKTEVTRLLVAGVVQPAGPWKAETLVSALNSQAYFRRFRPEEGESDPNVTSISVERLAVTPGASYANVLALRLYASFDAGKITPRHLRLIPNAGGTFSWRILKDPIMDGAIWTQAEGAGYAEISPNAVIDPGTVHDSGFIEDGDSLEIDIHNITLRTQAQIIAIEVKTADVAPGAISAYIRSDFETPGQPLVENFAFVSGDIDDTDMPALRLVNFEVENQAAVDTYQVLRKTGIGGTFALIGEVDAADGQTVYVYEDHDASDTENQYYRIRAVDNETGDTALSAIIPAIILPFDFGTITPSLPGGGVVDIDFEVVNEAENGVLGYAVYRDDETGGPYNTLVDTVLANGSPDYQITDATPLSGTNYYVVRAYTNVGLTQLLLESDEVSQTV